MNRRDFLLTSSLSPLAIQAAAVASPLEKVATFGVHEGPAWHPELGLLSSGEGKIFRYSRDGKVSVFRDPAGKPNGVMVDPSGRIVVCEQGNRRLTRTAKDGTITVLAERFDGMKFNSPNDLSIDSHGRIYFSDPRYGPRADMELKDAQEQTVEGVYRIDAPGKVVRVITHEANRPNGVLVSPRDQYLYVADNNNNTQGGARKLWRFALKPDGSIEPNSRKLIFDWETARGPDGVKMDSKGRLFVAAGLNKANPPYELTDKYKGGIYILSPDGQLLQFIAVPTDEVTNCAFGGDDLRTLFVTAGGTLYRVSVSDPGWIAGQK